MAKIKRPKTKNLIEFLESEMKDGNTLVAPDGEIISPDLFESDTRREYSDGIADESIDMAKVTYAMYREGKIDTFFETKYFLDLFQMDENEEIED